MANQYDFGVLRLMRKQHNLTLKQLSKKIGVAYSTVALIEQNKRTPSLHTLDALSAVLKVSTSHLLALCEHSLAKVCQASPFHDQLLENIGVNLTNCNIAEFEDLKILRASVEKGQTVNSMKLHKNCSCYEVCYVFKGTMKIIVGNQEYQLKENDVILFKGSVKHEYIAVDNSEFITMHMPINIQVLDIMLKDGDKERELIVA